MALPEGFSELEKEVLPFCHVGVIGEMGRTWFSIAHVLLGRLVSGKNLCVCTEKGQDLSSMDKCPS